MALKLKRLKREEVKTNIIPFHAPVKEEKKDKDFEVISTDPTSIERLLSQSRSIAEKCSDYMVVEANNENVRFNEDAGLTFKTSAGDVLSQPVSRWALSQLGTKIGVPARYLEKCVNTGRLELAQDNVNSWLSDYKKDLFIRSYDGGIRGILSNKYSVCDSDKILEVVDDAVDLSKYKVKGSFLSPERLHVRLIGKEMLPIDNEDLFAGLFIDSSDVGRNILTVNFGIYKQVCTNGLVVSRAGGTLFTQKHIGISAEEFSAGLISSLKNVDVLTDHAVEWVKIARSKNKYGRLSTMSEDDMNDFIARIKTMTLLPEEGAKKVIQLMQERYDDSQWGLINSITEVAQDYTLEKRLNLERVAGNLLIA